MNALRCHRLRSKHPRQNEHGDHPPRRHHKESVRQGVRAGPHGLSMVPKLGIRWRRVGNTGSGSLGRLGLGRTRGWGLPAKGMVPPSDARDRKHRRDRHPARSESRHPFAADQFGCANPDLGFTLHEFGLLPRVLFDDFPGANSCVRTGKLAPRGRGRKIGMGGDSSLEPPLLLCAHRPRLCGR